MPAILGFVAMFKMAGPKMADDMKNYQNALADMNNEAIAYVRGVPVVKTVGQTVHTFKRFRGSIDSYYKFCVAYCKKCRMPMLLYTVFINSAFAFSDRAGADPLRRRSGRTVGIAQSYFLCDLYPCHRYLYDQGFVYE